MHPLHFSLALALLTAVAGAAAQAPITHEQALAGNVTPGDAPGYPVTISVPGHYRLMGNLQVPSSTGGIHATVGGVTLDLNGFTVGGPGTCTQSGAGNVVTCTHYALAHLADRDALSGIRFQGRGNTVRNGTVRGFRGHGVSGGDTVLEDLVLRDNRYSGFSSFAVGHTSRVSGTRILLNGDHGVHSASYLIFERSAAVKNGGDGLQTGGALVTDSVLTNNRRYGIASSSNPHSTVRGTQLRYNHLGAISGGVLSQGGNYSGGALF